MREVVEDEISNKGTIEKQRKKMKENRKRKEVENSRKNRKCIKGRIKTETQQKKLREI